MNNYQQKRTIFRLGIVLIAFFVLAAFSIIIVYFVDPSIYAKVLKLEPAATDTYPFASTFFLVAILIFIAILIFLALPNIGAGYSGSFLLPTAFPFSRFLQRYFNLQVSFQKPILPGIVSTGWEL